MEVGARVWCTDDKLGWIPALIYRVDLISGKPFLVLKPDDLDEEVCFPVDSGSDELAEVKFMNRKEDSEVDSLLTLPFLNEPSILHCLECRFHKDLIYTYTGPILIAVNPFKTLDIYSERVVQQYREHTTHAPHLYAVADVAYSAMLKSIENNKPAHQSILISGESGAGKTESTKILLQFLTKASKSQDRSVINKVMQSNPILEAFGNARTIRNDNSSRFGKLIDLFFNKNGELIGGAITTYLLEKVRICSHSKGKYHLFTLIPA